MKRFLIIMLAALLIPVAACAGWMEGTAWVHSELTNERAPVTSYLYLGENGECYYSTYMFHPGKEAFGRTYNGTWKELSSGDIWAKTGEHTEMTLTFNKDQTKAMDELGWIYYYVYTFDLN